MLKVISKGLSVLILLLIAWDVFSEDIMILQNVIYVLLATMFALRGIADIKEKKKSLAYFSFFTSAIFLFGFLIYSAPNLF